MKAICSRTSMISLAVLLAAVMLGALIPGLLAPMAVQAEGEAPAGTIAGVRTYTFYPATALTGSGTVYSSAPRTQSGVDISHVRKWNALDFFVTVDIESTGTITVTPQFSADQINWADGDYRHITFSGNETTTVSTLNTQAYQIVLSSDDTDYINAVPIAGEYMRFKVEYSAAMTPTIRGTLRNN